MYCINTVTRSLKKTFDKVYRLDFKTGKAESAPPQNRQ